MYISPFFSPPIFFNLRLYRKKQVAKLDGTDIECDTHGPTASVYLFKTQVGFVNQDEPCVGYVKHTDAETLCGKPLGEVMGTSDRCIVPPTHPHAVTDKYT